MEFGDATLLGDSSTVFGFQARHLLRALVNQSKERSVAENAPQRQTEENVDGAGSSARGRDSVSSRASLASHEPLIQGAQGDWQQNVASDPSPSSSTRGHALQARQTSLAASGRPEEKTTYDRGAAGSTALASKRSKIGHAFQGHRVHPVSALLSDFVRDHLSPSWTLCAAETGGGGDCLFHSIGAILSFMYHQGGAMEDHVRRRVPGDLFQQRRHHLIPHLRNLCSQAWADKTYLDILNYLNSASQQERIPGAWSDQWSPTDLLARHGFGSLLGADTVEALGPNPTGDIGDIVISVTRTVAAAGGGAAVLELVPIAQGEAFLRLLVRDLQIEFQKVGNNHWGDVTDVQALSEALDLGVFIFADRLQDAGRKCLCSVHQTRGDLPYFVSIWWDNRVYFRVALLREGSTCEARCVWRSDALPEPLRLPPRRSSWKRYPPRRLLRVSRP